MKISCEWTALSVVHVYTFPYRTTKYTPTTFATIILYILTAVSPMWLLTDVDVFLSLSTYAIQLIEQMCTSSFNECKEKSHPSVACKVLDLKKLYSLHNH